MPLSFDDLIPQQPDPQQQPAPQGNGVLNFDSDIPQSAQPPAQQPWSGSFLPLSRDAQGNVSFDPTAGVLGGILHAGSAVGDAATGKLPVMDDNGDVTPEAIKRGWEFAKVFSPPTPGLRAGEGILGGPTRTKAPNIPTPTAQQLLAAGGDGFDTIRNMGVDYTTSSVNDLAAKIQADLFKDGFHPSVAPKTHAILNDLQQNPAGSVASGSDLIAARRAFGGAAQDFNNPSEQAAASSAVQSLDGFLSRPPATAVIRGPADQLGATLEDANANYAAGKRTEQLNDLKRAAEIRANGANSGANIGNSTRQRVGSMLLNPESLSGYSPSEVEGLEGVNAGSTAANLTRRFSNYLGGGGGLGAMITSALGSVPGMLMKSPELSGAGAVALPAVGHGLKELSNALTEKQLDGVINAVSQRSPLYQAAVANAPPPTAIGNAVPSALLRALMLKQQQQPQQQNQSNADWINSGGT